jgi:ubiquitin-conjugating enzyme E2 D/E
MAKRLQKEFAELNGEPPAFVKSVALANDNLYKWKIALLGPVCVYMMLPSLFSLTCTQDKSPYEKGVFQIELDIPTEYPFKPPKVCGSFASVLSFIRLILLQLKFNTKIYHPNIKTDGGVCTDILGDQWSPQLKISEVLITLRQVLAEPNPDNPLEPEIANQFKNDRNAFNKTAKEWTKKHAK